MHNALQQERKGWLGQVFNNWATAANATILVIALLAGWAQGILNVPSDIRDLKRAAEPMAAIPAKVEEHGRDIQALQIRLDAMEADNAKKNELLIRMDERLKSIQNKLGLNGEK